MNHGCTVIVSWSNYGSDMVVEPYNHSNQTMLHLQGCATVKPCTMVI